MSFAGGRGTSLPLGIAGVSPAGGWLRVFLLSSKTRTRKEVYHPVPALKQTASLPLKKMVVFGKYTFLFLRSPLIFRCELLSVLGRVTLDMSAKES